MYLSLTLQSISELYFVYGAALLVILLALAPFIRLLALKIFTMLRWSLGLAIATYKNNKARSR